MSYPQPPMQPYMQPVPPNKPGWRKNIKWIAIGSVVFVCSCLGFAYNQGSKLQAEQTATAIVVANVTATAQQSNTNATSEAVAIAATVEQDNANATKEAIAIAATQTKEARPTNTPVPTNTPLPPTATPFVAEIGQSNPIGQWEITILDISIANDFSEAATGKWLVVHGTITNKGDDHLIGKQELKVRTDTKTIELDRNASNQAAKRLNVTSIGDLGGKMIKRGEREEWAIAFDIPQDSNELWFTLEGTDAVKFGAIGETAELPTVTPRPTATAVPDLATEAGAIDVCKQAVKQRLTHPSTADFPWFDYQTVQEGDLTWYVQSTVKAKNSFNLEVEFVWVCKVTYEGNSRWNIDDVQMAEQ